MDKEIPEFTKEILSKFHDDDIGEGDEAAAEVDKFIAVLELNKDFLFGDATYAINKNRQVKLRKPEEMPLEVDMEKLRTHTVDEVEVLLNFEGGGNYSLPPASSRSSTATWSLASSLSSTATRSPASSRSSTATRPPASTLSSTATRPPASSRSSTATWSPASSRSSTATRSPASSQSSTATRPPASSLSSTATRPPASSLSLTATRSPASSWSSTATRPSASSLSLTATRSPASSLSSTATRPPASNLSLTATRSPASNEPTTVTRPPASSQSSTATRSPASSATRRRGNRKRRTPFLETESDSDEPQATSCPPEKARNYTRWCPADEALVVEHFSDIIKGNSSRSIPGRDDVEPFLKAHKLLFSWESVRNKVMNERVKRQRLLQKRADSFM
ncbi:uncharacterized protein [Littorina saxatilis]|uniref:uncharacterized protein n=1 Tax=Littorina saxatilis TaxID=31220 RepID=UPI0038B43333